MKPYYFIVTGLLTLLTACDGDSEMYDASGVFEVTEVIVSAESSGEILRLDVEEGQKLTAAELVGCIDTIQLFFKRQQMCANLSATESKVLDEQQQLASLRQQIVNLNNERERFEELVMAEAATQKQLDDINYQIEVLDRQLLAAQEKVASSNSSLNGQSAGIIAQIAQIDNQLANCVIASPINGEVLSKYAEQGEFAIQGQALFKVGNVKEMKLRAYVGADKLTTIKLGQPVKVYADLGESDRQEFDGVVSWISDEAEFTPKTIQTRNERSNLVYAIKITVKNDDGIIKRGMYGDVKF